MDFFSVLNHFPDIILQLNETRRILWINDRARSIKPEWKVGSSCFQCIRGMDSKCMFCFLEETFQEGKVTRNIVPNHSLSLQSGKGYCEQLGIPQVRDGGRVESVFLVLRDVTMEIQNVQRQVENDFVLSALFEASQSGVVMLNSGLVPVRVSQGFVDLTGFTQEDLETQSYRSLFSVEDWENISSWMKSVVLDHPGGFTSKEGNQKGSATLFVEIRRKGKTPIPVRIKLDLFPNLFQEDFFFLFQHREIQKMVPKVDEMRQAFMANLNHELRTPITAILGSLFLLEDTPLNEEQRKVLGWAEISSERMATLIGNLLEMCDLSSKQSKSWVENSVFSPEELVEKWQKQFSEVSRQKDIAFSFHGKNPGRGLVVGDAKKILELGSILLDNAFKFTKQGSVDLSLDVEENGMTCLQVRDTGCGIPGENQKSVFEPFFQVKSGCTGKDEGMGIGLAIAKELAELMEGSLEVQSPPQGGCLFVARLPLQVLPF
ncbi:MAG TPA: PAS domain-containing sensor histidine kinase [Thermotogota bacterium]|nr:PAS domain-containing sensor histidine kinase [Thermotogota bacterium]